MSQLSRLLLYDRWLIVKGFCGLVVDFRPSQTLAEFGGRRARAPGHKPSGPPGRYRVTQTLCKSLPRTSFPPHRRPLQDSALCDQIEIVFWLSAPPSLLYQVLQHKSNLFRNFGGCGCWILIEAVEMKCFLGVHVLPTWMLGRLTKWANYAIWGC